MKVITEGGEEIVLGAVEATPTISIIDFSRRETDDFGVTTVVERGFSRRLAVRLALPFDTVDDVHAQLAALRATPAQWIADDSLDWLQVTGFYKDFEIDLAVPPVSFCTLTVEGLAETEPGNDSGEDPAPSGSGSTLRLVQPLHVDDSVLTSSNLAETDHPQWSGGITYAAGARVLRSTHHRIYESAQGGNVGNDPASASGHWIDVGPTNRWAMFDQALGTATVAIGSVSVTLNATAADAVALLDVTGATVRVQAAGYDVTQAIGTGAITFLDMPLTVGAITVTITGPGSVSVGTLLAGRLRSLGITEQSPTAGIVDFSRKETDDFGEVTVVERAWAKRMAARALIRTDAIDDVANRIAAVRARPALWIGDEGLDSLTVYGFFKEFSIEVGENVSTLALSVEGLSKAAPVGALAPNWTDIVDNDPDRPKPEDGATDGATLPTDGPGNIRDENGSPWKPGELGNGGLTLIPDGRGFRLGYAPDITVPRIDMPTIEVPGVDLPEFGSPVGNVTMRIMRQVRPADMGAATDHAMRQAEGGLEQIAAAILGAQAELVRTRGVLRDAGIVVDPASGRVIIHALDRADERLNQVFVTLDAVNASLVLKASTAYVNNAIATAVLDPSQVPIFAGIEAQINEAQIDISALQAAVLLKASVVELDGANARITTAESEIDALNGQIVDKVETSDFSALEGRVTTVETIAFAIGDAAGIADTVRVTRLLFNEAETEAQNTLGALLAGDRDRRGTVSAIAEARREITAKIAEDVSAEAAARLALGVRVGTAEAGLVSEQTVRAAQDLALAQAITGLSASLGADVTAIEATLSAEQIARVEGDEALAGDIVQLSSGVGRDSELQAVAALSALIEGDRAKRSASAAIAAARQELGTRLTDGQAAEAMARLALLARIQLAEASILQEQGVRATADEAIAFAISELTAGIADEVSDRAAAVTAEAQARVDGDGALAARADTIEASIADEATARAASVASEAQARVDGDVALAARADALEASIADEATARSAAVTAEAGARVDGDAAVAASVDALETSFSSELADVAAAVTAEAGARTTADAALAARADTIEASIAGEVANRTAAVSNEAQARVAGDAAEATARQALSVTLDNTAVALAAAVENEEIARVQGDGALAADIDAVSTTVNGHTATITQYGESIDGLEARAGVILDVNGRATGWRTAAGEQTDYFDIISDLVRVIDPDTGEIMMGLVGGLMRLRGIEVDTVKANVIDTVQIKLGGVNGTTIVTKPTTQINSSTPDILTYTLPSIPNGVVSVSLRFAGTVECLQDGLDDYNWLLKKSGTLVTGAFHNNIGRAGGFLAFVEAEYTELIPVAGTVYTVDYRSRTGQNIILSNGVLVSEFRYR